MSDITRVMPKMIADLVMASIADKDKRIAELERSLRDLLAAVKADVGPAGDFRPDDDLRLAMERAERFLEEPHD